MARTKSASPTLKVRITEENYATAKRSKSGGCLIADAITRQYPNLSHVDVDMATIRVTDPKAGQRFIYLTPPAAQHLLLAFDQGWRNPTEELTVKRAVQITPVVRPKNGPRSTAGTAKSRGERITELTSRIDNGEELTTSEKRSLGRLLHNETAAQTSPPPERPTSYGPTEVLEDTPKQPVVIKGGRRPPKHSKNPNLLTGRNRHFGAKLADPGLAFAEAVAQAVAEHLAEPDQLDLTQS